MIQISKGIWLQKLDTETGGWIDWKRYFWSTHRIPLGELIVAALINKIVNLTRLIYAGLQKSMVIRTINYYNIWPLIKMKSLGIW